MVPFDVALRIEARWFTSVLMNPSSAAMIRSLFINKEALDKGANRPAVADQSVKRVGIIGAGMMGAGIAYVSANAGIEVVLIDAAQDAADRGKAYSEGLLDKGIARRKVTATVSLKNGKHWMSSFSIHLAGIGESALPASLSNRRLVLAQPLDAARSGLRSLTRDDVAGQNDDYYADSWTG